MKIWKRTILIFSFLLLLNHCGYTPVFVMKNSAFEISKFEIPGDEKIANSILQKLKSLQNTSGENLNLIFISINALRNKKDLVKNVSGKVISYQIEIILNIESKNITTNELIYVGNVFDGTNGFNMLPDLGGNKKIRILRWLRATKNKIGIQY